MTVFKTYFKLLRSSSVTLIIYSLVFLVMLFVFSSNGQSYDKPLCYLVVKDDSEIATGISEYIEKNTDLVNIENESIEDALFYSDIDIYICINENFDTNYNFTINYSKDSISASNFQNELLTYTGMVKTYLENDLATTSNVFTQVNDVLNNAASKTEIVLKQSNTDQQSSFYSFAGYILSALIITSINSIMISYKPIEIRRRVNISSYGKNRLNLETILGHIVITTVYVILIALLARFFAKDYHYQSIQLLNLFIYSLVFTSLGMLINQIFNSRAILSALSTVIPLAGAFIGGLFVSLDLMSDSVIKISRLIPQYYYLLNSMHIEKTGTMDSYYTLMQLAFILVFGILIMIVSNINQKREN